MIGIVMYKYPVFCQGFKSGETLKRLCLQHLDFLARMSQKAGTLTTTTIIYIVSYCFGIFSVT